MELIKKLDMRFATNKSKKKARYGLFLCPVCKTTCQTYISNGLKAKSCRPCVNIAASKKMTTHGGRRTRPYRTWMSAKDRCNNKNSIYYKNYGGRGIKVCDEWSKFEPFRDWALANGYSDDLTIDRIDNDKGYSPDNCRFVSRNIQMRNTRKIKINNKSGFRGVCWYKAGNKWVAQICVDRKQVYLGRYTDKLDAAKAYDRYVIDNNLEHTTNGLI